MKVTIPEHIGDITLSQYLKYMEVMKREDINDFEKNKRLIHIFCGVPKQKLNLIDADDFGDLLKDIEKAVNEECEFVQRFEMNGREYGFIPNFDKLTGKEFFDLSLYAKDEETTHDNLHKIMAILFRPVVKSDKFGNYQIESYNGTAERCDEMMSTPMNVVNGALVFFSTLAKELRVHILKSTIQQELAREVQQQTTLKNGVGMQHSTN